jgi:inorganic pyrophosphatase
MERITPGQDVPDDINVISEIPAHDDPVKYEAGLRLVAIATAVPPRRALPLDPRTHPETQLTYGTVP